ncbi:bifunctional GNAT family N-acetyltransferase/carbon-nitrogen hydrolase family protein [Haliangium ochraceum]|nr:bifunctional GNAT family N-acetyltransferase/carbon-nitrogen hydrolase family protein [Haliangium ochraceum]
MSETSENKNLTVRTAVIDDIPRIRDLVHRVYEKADLGTYSEAMLRGQINSFPEGKFIVEYGDDIVGYCSTFLIDGETGLNPHTWTEITGGGFGSRHNPEGDYLYGMEVCVDPAARGLRIGQRLYNERKKLCRAWRLRGIIIVGRIPSMTRRLKKYDSPEALVEDVVAKKTRDQVLSFQLRNGFEYVRLLPGYLPSDHESAGYGVQLVWHNPHEPSDEREYKQRSSGHVQDLVRVATVQYMQRRVESFDHFVKLVRYFVDVVSDYRADFVVFPELFTLQLLSMEDEELKPAAAIEQLTRYVPRLKEVLRELAMKYNVNIIGGSHPTHTESGAVQNIAYVCLRDGTVHEQPKLHPTPSEVRWWNIEGGDTLKAIDTDCGPIGVLICYDSEFPELARHLIDQGANILFVPFCTDERQSYLRVRYSCQARAVENQCYVVMSGNVGNLPNVSNMDIQYAQSCILTPCDFPFARDGIAADTTPNVETVAFADLRMESLRYARNSGTVRNLKNRRHDLYRVVWNEKKPS